MVTDQSAAHHDNHEQEAANTKVYGFWLYLMTDCIMFASVFATYVVLSKNFAGGPTGKDLFELPFVLVETAFLLLSSITCGMAMIASQKENAKVVIQWLALTFLFGACFIGMELYEFHHLISIGAGPDRSAFLSGFFALVGMHGVHVTIGLIWMLVLMVQFAKKGTTLVHRTRLTCFSLFWHFLDIVWICVFSVVYLMGVI